MVHPLEELGVAALVLGLLDLEEVGVDEVAYVPFVEGGAVLFDRLLEEGRHLRAVRGDLVAYPPDAGQVPHHGYEVDGHHVAEETEALLDQGHEPLEPAVPVAEPHPHYYRAYHVADGHPQRRGYVGRRAGAHRERAQEGVDLALENHETGET